MFSLTSIILALLLILLTSTSPLRTMHAVLLGGRLTTLSCIALGVCEVHMPCNFSIVSAELLRQYQLMSLLNQVVPSLRHAAQDSALVALDLRDTIPGLPGPKGKLRNNNYRTQLASSANDIGVAISETTQKVDTFAVALSELGFTLKLLTEDAIASSNEYFDAFERRILSPDFQLPYQVYHNAVVVLNTSSWRLMALSADILSSLSVVDSRIDAARALLSSDFLDWERSKRRSRSFFRGVSIEYSGYWPVVVWRMVRYGDQLLKRVEDEVSEMKNIVTVAHAAAASMWVESISLLANSTEALHNGTLRLQPDIICTLRAGSLELEKGFPVTTFAQDFFNMFNILY